MPTETTTETRLLGNYIGGRWVPAPVPSRRARRHQPRHRRGAGTRAALRRRPTSTPPSRPRARRSRLAQPVDDRARALAVRLPPGARGAPGRAGPVGDPRDGQDAARTRGPRSAARSRWSRPRSPSRRRCRAASSRTSRRPSTARPSASRSASARRSCRSTSRRWCPFWFLPFAIACGNTFILKPSEQVPLTQELVFNLIDDAGGLPRRRRQPRQRLGRRRQRHPRPSRHRRHLVRRLGQGRQVRLRARRPPPASACRRWAAPRTTWS